MSIEAALQPAAILVVNTALVVSVSVRLARRAAPAVGEGVERATVGVLLALVQIVGVLQLMGLLHLLRRWPVLLAHVTVAAAVLGLVRPAPSSRPRSRWPGWGPWAAGVTAAGFGAMAVVFGLRGRSREFDTIQYHVPNAAFWLQRGALWPLPFATPGVFTNVYPANAELVGLWLMLPTHDDTLVYLAPVLFAALAVLGTALLARELGARAWLGALTATAIVASPTSFSTQVNSLLVDLAAAGALVAAAAFAVRATRQRAWSWLALAGAATGLGLGAKTTALLPALAIVALIVALARRGDRLRSFVMAAVPAAGLSALWYLRTWVATGNPIFPKGLTIAGHQLLTPGRGPVTVYDTSMLQHVASRQFHAVRVWAHLARVGFGPSGLLVAGGLLAGTWLGWRRRSRPVIAVTLLAWFGLVVYLAEPYTGGGPAATAFIVSSQLRHALGAALLGVALVALLPRVVAVPVTLAALAYDTLHVLKGPGFRPDLNPSGADLLRAAAIAAAVLAVGWAATRHGAGLAGVGPAGVARPSGGGSSRVAAAAAAVAALSGAVLAGAALISALPGPAAAPALARLAAAGRRHPRILLVGVTDVRAVLGPDFAEREVTAGGGGADHEIPIWDRRQLDQRIAALAPDAIAVGLGPSVDRPPGWLPGPPWTRVGSVSGSALFVRGSGP